MDKKRKARIIKGLLTIGATGIMCDACAGEATKCVYGAVRNNEPITLGPASQITLPQLPIMAQALVTFGSL